MGFEFDAIVIGTGSAGLACATALAQGGMTRVAAIEHERVGGECAFWACVPSKVLLRSGQPTFESRFVPGSKSGDAPPVFPQAAAWRNAMVDRYRDTAHAAQLGAAGVALLRGTARIEGANTVSVNGLPRRAQNIIIATGSTERLPQIDGLGRVAYWTSRDATAAENLPESLIVLGGGAVGVELAQAFARYGTRVTIVETSPRILPAESPRLSDFMREQLERGRIHIMTGAKATAVDADATTTNVHLHDGQTLHAAKMLLAMGREPGTRDLGIESIGIALGEDGCIPIDSRCRAATNVYAVGDVTGKALFTHVAKYQGRIAAATILGHEATASYDAVPRCLYTAPEVAAVGTTFEQAQKDGIDAARANVTYDEITRPEIYFENGVRGAVELVGDRARKRLVGGWIAGPMASEAIGFVSLAIRSGAGYATLLDVIHPYPTFSEALYVAVDRLARS